MSQHHHVRVQSALEVLVERRLVGCADDTRFAMPVHALVVLQAPSTVRI